MNECGRCREGVDQRLRDTERAHESLAAAERNGGKRERAGCPDLGVGREARCRIASPGCWPVADKRPQNACGEDALH